MKNPLAWEGPQVDRSLEMKGGCELEQESQAIQLQGEQALP